MEAFSITPATADYRPTKAQAQNSLGDIFQALLRDSAQQAGADLAPTRSDLDRNRIATRRGAANDAADERADRRQEPNADIGAIAAPSPAAPRPDVGNDAPVERPAATDHVDRPADGFSAADRQAAPTETPSNDTAGSAESAVAAELPDVGTEDTTAAPGDPAQSGDQGRIPPIAAPVALGATALVAPTVTDGITDSADAQIRTGGTVPTTEPAPKTDATAALAKSSNGAVRVSVVAPPLVAPPSANLGAGATVAALAASPSAGAGVPPATADQSGVPANTISGTTAGEASPRTTGQPAPAVAAVAQAAAGLAPAKPSAQSATGSNPVSTPGAETSSPVPATAVGTAGSTSSADGPDAQLRGNQTGAAAAQAAPAPGATARPAVAQTGPAQIDAAQTKTDRAGDSVGGSTTTPAGSGQDASARTANPAAPPASAPSQQASVAARAAVESAATAGTGTPAPSAATPTQGANASPLPVPSQVAAASDAETAGGTDSSVGRVASAPGTPALGIGHGATRLPETLSLPIRAGASQPVTIDQVAVEIQKAASAGKDHIRIRLNPAELGQIDVTLKVGQDGHVKAVVTADKPETYQLLQRDMRGLERALQDAGLKTDSGSLSFNLRGEGQNGQADRQPSTPGAAPILRTGIDQSHSTEDPTLPPPAHPDRVLDIRV